MWSSADLHNVAQFATVEAKTTMKVFLHWVGVVQVHRLGGWRCCGSGRLGEGGGFSSGGGENRRGAQPGWICGGSLRLVALEPPPPIVQLGGRACVLYLGC